MFSLDDHPLEEDSILLSVATLISDRASTADVFAAFAGRIVDVASFDFASLLVHDPVTDDFRGLGVYPVGSLPNDAPRSYRREEINVELLGQFDDGIAYAPDDVPTVAAGVLARYGIGMAWSIPILDGAETVGVLTVARLAAEPFSVEECHFLCRATALLAGPIRDEVRVRRMRQEAGRSHLLTQIAVLLNSGQPALKLFPIFQSLLTRAVPSDIVLLTEAGGVQSAKLIGAAGIRDPEAFASSVASWLGTGDRLPDGRHTTALVSAVNLPASVAALFPGGHVAIASLRRGHESLGTLLLGRASKLFTHREREYLEVVATLLGQALAVEREREGTRRELQEQRVIAQMVAAAARETDPAALTEAVAGHLRTLVDEPVVCFGFRSSDDSVEFGLANGRRVVLTVGDLSAVDDADQWTIDATAPHDPARLLLDSLGRRTAVFNAARAGGVTLGYLVVAVNESARELPPQLLSLFSLLAQIIGPIAHQSRVAKEATREQALLRLVIDSLNDGVILVDRNNQVAYQNAQSWLATSLIGGVLNGSPQGNEAPAADDARRQLFHALDTGQPAQGRAEVHTAGQRRWLDYRFIPLDSPSFRLLCMVHDATEQVEAEAQREQHREDMERTERLSALGSLVGGVAHELNNPLTAILGFAELLDAEVPDGPARDDLRIISREAQRARNIVQDLLFVARATPLDRRAFTIDTVVGHIERIRRSSWLRDNVTFCADLGSGTTPIWGNEDRITQVLLNLITNAEDAVRGTSEATIRVLYEEKGGHAFIEVRDNGTGMDTATQRRIFEPFFTTKQGTGTGLGLSVSYSIVMAHDGRLEVESAPGRGSCFRIVLPLEPAAAAADPDPAPVKTDDRTKLRVLVIDDEPSLRRVCQRLIQSLGHECTLADGPDAAAKLAHSNDFDVVLCDYRLAASSADAVIERFGEVRPQLIGRTVIATGAASDTDVQALVRRHGLRLLPKPYGADELSGLLLEVGAA